MMGYYDTIDVFRLKISRFCSPWTAKAIDVAVTTRL